MWQQIQLYFQDNMSSYVSAIGTHLAISLAALCIAISIGVPAGFLSVRFHQSRQLVMNGFAILRVIPSLAVLLLLIPILGTGLAPALTALVLLAIPPILMSTIAGLEDVSGFVLETANGCGMTSWQVWYKVRFPLALSMILSGIKIAMIEIIASATLAAKIGAGGLGEIIFTGIGLNRYDLLLIGGVTVAILSLSASLLFEAIDRIVLPYQHL